MSLALDLKTNLRKTKADPRELERTNKQTARTLWRTAHVERLLEACFPVFPFSRFFLRALVFSRVLWWVFLQFVAYLAFLCL